MADIKIKVFFSYSHEDEAMRDELAKHLKALERQGKIEAWHDRKIDLGKDWRKELDLQLNSADIVLLLVSASFVSSDFCFCDELEKARKRHDADESRMIPIFLRAIDFEALAGSPLETLQGLPEPSNPIASWKDRDEAFTHVAKGIRKVVEEVCKKKESQQTAKSDINNPQSAMRSRVADEHYIERQEAKRLLGKFADAIKQPDGQPLLFNICGIGGVGKTTLLGRLKDAHVNEVDFLEVCFAKNKDSIETPLKLMRKLHKQAIDRFGGQAMPDSFTQQEGLFEKALFELSRRSIDGEATGNDETTKIISWFERFVWLGTRGLTFTPNKSKSFDGSGLGFSALSVTEDDTENRQELMQQLVRNHPATKDQPELQSLMLEPVSNLTQAFAESMMQISRNRGRSLVLILDTYEKAQPYLNQWLWQYLVEDTPLHSSSVRLVVVGRRSLQADEGWRKLNQDRKLLHETPLIKFSKSETENYLKKIGFEQGSTINKIYKVTQGLPYYLDWVRDQSRDQNNKLDFSKGNQAISDLLFQGLDANQQKILQVVSCCRWFDLSMIRYLLGSNELGLHRDTDNAEHYFEWLKLSDFIEFTKGHFCFDDVAQDVFRQSYFQTDQDRFRKTNALLANYFKQKADELFAPQSLLPDPYKDEEWRELISEFLYYGLFGKGREGLLKYVEHIFTSVYLQEPDVFLAPFTSICAEISEENQNLLPKATHKFLKDSGMVISFGGRLLSISPKNYKINFEGDHILSEENKEIFLKQVEVSVQSLLERVGDLQDGFGKCVGMMYKSLRSNSLKERIRLGLQAKSQTEQLQNQCRPKLLYSLFLKLGFFLSIAKRYEASLDCYQQALELEPSNPNAFLLRGDTLSNLNRYEEASESYQKVVDLDPISVKAWVNLGATLVKLERYEEALESFQKAVNLDPKFVIAWINLGSILSHLERHEEAIESFQKAVNLDPNSVIAFERLGASLFNLDRYEEAIESYQKAANLDTKSFNVWINLGSILSNLERHEEAIESFQKAVNLDPNSVIAFERLGASLFNLDRYEEALESYQKVVNLDPKSINSWIVKGNLLSKLERYEEALEDFQKAIEFDAKTLDAWIGLTDTLMSMRRYDESLAVCNQFLEINPNHDGICNNQALVLSLLKDFEKALIAIDKPINLEPHQVLFRANRGIILARAGRYSEAIIECEQAINQDPNHESGYYGKACCYALQGYLDQAIDSLRKAIDIAPHHSRREAKHNPDFDGIRDDERFQSLVYLKT